MTAAQDALGSTKTILKVVLCLRTRSKKALLIGSS